MDIRNLGRMASFSCLLVAAQLPAQAGVIETYDFVGACSEDCTGVATATLKVLAKDLSENDTALERERKFQLRPKTLVAKDPSAAKRRAEALSKALEKHAALTKHSKITIEGKPSSAPQAEAQEQALAQAKQATQLQMAKPADPVTSAPKTNPKEQLKARTKKNAQKQFLTYQTMIFDRLLSSQITSA